MSDRGSFVTEYIYCDKCFSAAKGVLLKNEKHLRGMVVLMWGDSAGELPIIAGKIGGGYAGGDLHMFETDIVPALAAVLCHTLRIVVLADSGERTFAVSPAAGCANKTTDGVRKDG